MHAWFISQYITFRLIGGNKHKCRAIHFCYVHILEGGRKKILLGGEQYMQYLKVDDFRIILVIF